MLFLAGGNAVAQRHDAPLRVMRGATLERHLLFMPTDAPAPDEVYVDGVRIRVFIEDGSRVYQTFHRGVTLTLYVALDASLRYVTFDTERNRFELLPPGLRVEVEDHGLLDQIIAAADWDSLSCIYRPKPIPRTPSMLSKVCREPSTYG